MIQTWTSRKRIAAALNHQEPDRVPMDLTITIRAYQRLRDYLGLPPEPDVKVDAFTEVTPDPVLLQLLGVDMTFVRLRSPAHWRPCPADSHGVTFDEWGVGRRQVQVSEGITLNEVVVSPLRDACARDLAHYPWPDPSDSGRIVGLEQDARQLYKDTDLALMGRFGGTILEQAAYLRGWEQFLVDLVTDTEFACTLLDIIAGIQIEMDAAGLQAAGQYLSVFKVSGEDLGMQDRPLFSMRVWREVLRPPLERRWRAARACLDRIAPHVKILLHSDGAIRPFLPDLIACGIDMIDPVQPDCPGMELAGLKRDFRERLSFHGGVDTHRILPFGTVEDVQAATLDCMRTLGTDGGYILAPVHNVQGDVPPENLVAMYRTVVESLNPSIEEPHLRTDEIFPQPNLKGIQ